MEAAYFFFSFFFLLAGSAAAADNLNDEVLGLIVVKSDITDPTSALSSWNEDSLSPCSWNGVFCDPSTSHVASVSLPSLSLSGNLSTTGLRRLPYLSSLSLPHNLFAFSISTLSSLFHLTALHSLDFTDNHLSGPLPQDFFSQCSSLRSLSLAQNSISGQLTDGIASCSSLVSLNLSHNRLSGPLPQAIWLFPALRSLDLSGNSFSGAVPKAMTSLSSLRTVNLNSNQLTGSMPADFGNGGLLKWLDLGSNSLSGSFPESFRSLTSIRLLNLSDNMFSGIMPVWIGELQSLEVLDMSGNRFSGDLPEEIGKLEQLRVLRLAGNGFSGKLPVSVDGCRNLEEADLRQNSFSGDLPQWVFGLSLRQILISHNIMNGSIVISRTSNSTARIVDLSNNRFEGAIPLEISLLWRLEALNLSSNRLSGNIPAEIADLKSLQLLDLSANELHGRIPMEIGAANSLTELKLAKNLLAGNIPPEIGKCCSITLLDLSQNNLVGSIPWTLANLSKLEMVDLSQNKLTGTIPRQFSELSHLLAFNVSHNLLSGEVPDGAFFSAIPPSALFGNPDLCASTLKHSCTAVFPKPIVLDPNSSSNPSSLPADKYNDLHGRKIMLSISALIAIVGAAIIAVGVLTITILNHHVHVVGPRSAAAQALSDDYLSQSPEAGANSGKLVMFGGCRPEFGAGGLAFLNKDCEIGRGGFGTVYKTVLPDGHPVAIKKLTVSSLVKSRDEFEREVRLLGKLRHRNLVPLRGFYWTSSLQLLIYDFIPKGNLHKHLHEHSGSGMLSWQERFNIVLGIARGLAHLHRHNMMHYNLKASNIILDGSREAKIGDYGLAKLLPMLDRYVLSSKIQSALGYMAPEFASQTVKITNKCDVYSFGVLVLEVITGRRPVEYSEDDIVVLCDIVRSNMDRGMIEDCIDENLRRSFPVEVALPFIKLALVCTSQVPANRPDMSEVVNMLQMIRCPDNPPEELA